MRAAIEVPEGGTPGDAPLPGRRAPALELTFLGVVWVGTAALLWHGLSLDLWRDDTIGPGAYPVFALVGLLAITTTLIAKALAVRELRIYSPFAAGLQDDSRLRLLAAAMAARAGVRLRVVTQDGEGRFSALWRGLRAGKAGDILTVASSDLSSLPNFHAAALCHGRLAPIGGLFFDPDVMVVAPESPWRSPSDLHATERRPRIGFGHHPDVDHAVDRWLGVFQGLDFETICCDEDAWTLDALRAGRLDAAVLRMSRVRHALAVGGARCIAIFSDPKLHAGMPGAEDLCPAAPPVASGHWAALMAPYDMAPEKRLLLEQAFVGAMTEMKPHHQESGTGREWRFLSAADIGALIDMQWRCAERLREGSAAAKPPRGKVVALAVAIVGLASFPFVMPWLGFVVTAFCYVVTLMLLLWPRLTPARAGVSFAAAAALSVGTWLLFTEVFSILLPGAALLEVAFP